jgi:phosphohistidine phosphatase
MNSLGWRSGWGVYIFYTQNPPQLEPCTYITPDEDPVVVLTELKAWENNAAILLVSHQPLVSMPISLLVDGHIGTPIPMGTCSIACLETDCLEPGNASLTWLKHALD